MLTIETDKRECPICGGNAVRATEHYPAAYWRCEACGTSHLFPQPSGAELDDFYEQYHAGTSENVGFARFEARTAQDFPTKASLVQQMLAGSRAPHNCNWRVLDVGCGKGVFVRELQRLGIDAEGIDVSTEAIQAGAAAGVTSLRSGHVETQSEWHGRFDAVTMFATIEHSPDPLALVRAAHYVLKPGGLLFLDTGVCDDFAARWVPGLIQWYHPPEHLFVFSTHGLRHLMTRAGFAVAALDRRGKAAAQRSRRPCRLRGDHDAFRQRRIRAHAA